MRYESGWMRRIGLITVGVIVVLWAIRDPAGAGRAVHMAGRAAVAAADAFGTLVRNA